MPILLSFLSFVFVIVQQPSWNTLYVSPDPGVVTQYIRPQTSCSTGPTRNIVLLGEEVYAEEQVAQLKPNHIITLTFDHHKEYFRVVGTPRFIASSPYTVQDWDDFRSLQTGEVFTSFDLGESLFCKKAYHLVIQTCFDDTKGRLFIIAEPIYDDRRIQQ